MLGVQKIISLGKGGFLELENFDKVSFTAHKRNFPLGEILKFFLINTLKTAYLIRNVTHRLTQAAFSPKIRIFFSIFKKGQGDLPPSLVVTCLRAYREGFVTVISVCFAIAFSMSYRNRSSHQICFVNKGILRNFAKFTGKHMCLLRPATLLKKRLRHRCFPVNFPRFLRRSLYRIPPNDLFYLNETSPLISCKGLSPNFAFNVARI